MKLGTVYADEIYCRVTVDTADWNTELKSFHLLLSGGVFRVRTCLFWRGCWSSGCWTGTEGSGSGSGLCLRGQGRRNTGKIEEKGWVGEGEGKSSVGYTMVGGDFG